LCGETSADEMTTTRPSVGVSFAAAATLARPSRSTSQTDPALDADAAKIMAEDPAMRFLSCSGGAVTSPASNSSLTSEEEDGAAANEPSYFLTSWTTARTESPLASAALTHYIYILSLNLVST
jgi:hypothetical protein